VVNIDNLQLPFWLFDFEEAVGILVRGGTAQEQEAQALILKDAIIRARRHYAGQSHAAAMLKSTQLTLQATQLQTLDLGFFTTFVEATFRGDKKLADFALMRFRPEARRAVDAWLQTDPFNNPNAPVRPLAMAEYASPEREAAKRADEEQARMLAAAQQASRSSDEYVLLTVRFTAVLFFGGIVSTFESQRLRTGVFLLAVALFTLSTIVMATLPICRE
jgi:hypothetical protein